MESHVCPRIDGQQMFVEIINTGVLNKASEIHPCLVQVTKIIPGC